MAIAGLIINALGVLIVALYTFYTRQMQKSIEAQVAAAREQTEELIHQRRLSVLPAFVSIITKIHGGISYQDLVFVLKNIGIGVALNVQILKVGIGKDGTEKLISFTPVACLFPHEDSIVPHHYERSKDSTPGGPDYLTFLSPGKIDDAPIIKIEFFDIEGNKYCQELQMNMGVCRPYPVKAIPS